MGIAAGVVLFFGVVLLIWGGVGLPWALVQSDRRVRARLLSSRTQRLGELSRPGMEARITGRVVGTPGGLVRSPITWQDVVLFRTSIARRKGDEAATVNILHREGAEVPFWLDDGSGVVALVRASAFSLVLRVSFEAGDATLTAPLQEWVRGRLGQLPGRLQIEEKLISVGDEVTVVGVAGREVGPSGEQVLTLSDSPGRPLFLTSYSPSEAAAELNSNVAMAIGIAVTGLLLLGIGAVLYLLA